MFVLPTIFLNSFISFASANHLDFDDFALVSRTYVIIGCRVAMCNFYFASFPIYQGKLKSSSPAYNLKLPKFTIKDDCSVCGFINQV